MPSGMSKNSVMKAPPGAVVWKTILRVRTIDQIRCWGRVGFCALLCLAVHGRAIAETETSPSPTKPAQTTAAADAKTKHHATARGTSTKRASSQKGKSSRGKKGKKRGQQVIDSARARKIQEALI